MAKFVKHPRWGEVNFVVGYVDYHGAVHATIIFSNQRLQSHDALFPNSLKYKTWRWSKNSGLEDSTICSTEPTVEDYITIRNWLFKNGCLNIWELEDNEV